MMEFLVLIISAALLEDLHKVEIEKTSTFLAANWHLLQPKITSEAKGQVHSSVLGQYNTFGLLWKTHFGAKKSFETQISCNWTLSKRTGSKAKLPSRLIRKQIM